MNVDSTVFDALPDLPQVACIRHAAVALDARSDVQAYWLGGSFAHGRADRFSDVDMRIAVDQAALAAWRQPDLAGLAKILGDAVVGHQMLPFDDAAFLHHLVLGSGTIIDFYVQSVDHHISPDAHLILKCDDAAVRDRIRSATVSERPSLPKAGPQELQAVIEAFWITSHKHAKVLFRNLDLLVLTGLEQERALLMRLWYADITGRDIGKRRPTIHLLTPVTRTIQEHLGPRSFRVLGAPLSTRSEILTWIATTREEVRDVGTRLAAKHGFTYPEKLEQTVRQSWRESEKVLGAEGGPRRRG